MAVAASANWIALSNRYGRINDRGFGREEEHPEAG
jgi:hypothetical protein